MPFFLVLPVLLCRLCAAAEPSSNDQLRELPEFASVNGVLTATLEAKEQKIHLGPIAFDGATYNGEYAGPVLRAHPGDVMRIKLVNSLSEPTNLHFHGLHASPLGKGDNMHIVVEPGKSFDYEVLIPANQPPGLYWYHTHIHGIAEKQTSGGLSGALVIEGLEKQLPKLANLKERLFVLKDHQFTDSDDPEVKNLHKLVQSINGQLFSNSHDASGRNATVALDQPKRQSLFPHCAEGPQVPHRRHRRRGDQSGNRHGCSGHPPASRMEALVDAGTAGAYDLVAEHTMTGSGNKMALERVLGRVTVAGDPVAPLAAISAFPDKKDLRARKIDERRTFTFTQLNDDKTFLLNGKKFDHARIDTRVPLGNTEEWTIKNDTDDMHVFHIHQIHFQLVEINGQPQPFEGYLDDVRVPERGEVKLILPFTEPQIVGTFMYHCHVLKHEDGGMMGIIEVYDPKNADASPHDHQH